MWFDARAKPAEIRGTPLATSATLATNAPNRPPVSQVSQVSQPPEDQNLASCVASVAIVASPLDRELILDLFEERAAIREFCGGQTRAEAEAGAVGDVAKSTGIYPPTLRQLRIGRGND
jgi:hypothetical protein